MSRPRRSITARPSSSQRMVSWDNVDLEDDEDDDFSDQEENNSSTDFGSDDIYMSEPEEEVDNLSDDGVQEEALPPVEDVLGPETIERDLERNFEERIAREDSTRDWSFNFQEELADDMRDASGVGVAKRRGRRPGATAGPRLSADAQRAFGEANLAFVSGQTEAALNHFQEVIRMEPKHVSSWNALATCYEQLGDHERALQVEIMGAHLKSDADQWFQLGQKSRDRGLVQQALYCYTKACRLSSDFVDAYWELATVCKEIGNIAQAVQAFQTILKTHPHNISVINQLLPLASELKSFNTIIDILQGAFNHYRQIWPHGPPSPPNPQDPEEASEPMFQDYHVVALADLLIAVGKYEQAIKAIRNGARWLQGRSREIQYESIADDREFDADGVVRINDGLLAGETSKLRSHRLDVNMRHRLARARIKNGDTQEGRLHCVIVLRQDLEYFVELFIELADAFVEKSLYLDALPIYERVMQSGKEMNFPTVMNLGQCYRTAGRFSEAEDMYSMVLENDPDNRDAKLKLAEVYEALNEPKKALALVYEVIDARKKENEADSNAPDNGASTEDAAIITAPKAAGRGRKTTVKKTNVDHRQTRVEVQAKEKERTTEILISFATILEGLDTLYEQDEAAIQIWMSLALGLVDDFREAKELFPASRYSVGSTTSRFKGLEGEEELMASRLEAEITTRAERTRTKPKDFVPTSYRGISFENWLKVIVHYSLMLTRRGQGNEALEILSHICTSYVFYPKNDLDARVVLMIAQMAIASYIGNQPEIITLSRTMTNENQFNNEPLRIMLASLTPGLRGTDAFIDRNMTKWGLRLNRVWDMGVEVRKIQQHSRASVSSESQIERDISAMELDGSDFGKEKLKAPLRWSDLYGRWIPTQKQKDLADAGEEDKEEEEAGSPVTTRQPTKLPATRSPLARLIQGSMLNASKTNHGALYYLFEAHEVQPQDPLLCLSIAVSTLGRSLGRRADNRQHLIVQGIAFLEEYRKHRGKDNVATQEVEYNFGRFFHQLNLGSFAAKHYKRVLELAEEWQQDHPEDPGFGPEAAYNLSLLYVFSGATPLAKQLYQRWLSI